MSNTAVERWQALVVASGRQAGRSITVGPSPIVIGCSPECDLVVDGHGVARRHAEVFRAQRGIFVRDLKSGVGTYLNGDPIPGPVRLQAGDSIMLADVTLQLGEVATVPRQRLAPDPTHNPEILPTRAHAPASVGRSSLVGPGLIIVAIGAVLACLGMLAPKSSAMAGALMAELGGINLPWAGLVILGIGCVVAAIGVAIREEVSSRGLVGAVRQDLLHGSGTDRRRRRHHEP